MKYLKKNQLSLVKPKFRPMVSEAWARGEKVPFGVTSLSDEPLTEIDIEQVERIIKIYNIKDE